MKINKDKIIFIIVLIILAWLIVKPLTIGAIVAMVLCAIHFLRKKDD